MKSFYLVALLAATAVVPNDAATVLQFIIKNILAITSSSSTAIVPSLRVTNVTVTNSTNGTTGSAGGAINDGTVTESSPSTLPGTGSSFVCPTPSLDSMCMTLYEPVLCDELCPYGNSCEAIASGYVAETQCRFQDPFSEEEANPNNENAAAASPTPCPTMSAGSMCTMEWEPFVCNATCSYGNRCEAVQAGYNVEAHCQREDF